MTDTLTPNLIVAIGERDISGPKRFFGFIPLDLLTDIPGIKLGDAVPLGSVDDRIMIVKSVEYNDLLAPDKMSPRTRAMFDPKYTHPTRFRKGDK